ncbi:MAG: hypothetical protein AB1416_06455 [Actinomycetota bacterium]
MADDVRTARDVAAAALGHPVPVALPAGTHGLIVALSAAGDPPFSRVAWVDAASGAAVARVACPPGRPSRARPVVATSVTVDEPPAPTDHVLVARAAAGVAAVSVAVAGNEGPAPAATVGEGGLAGIRLDAGAVILGVDALDARGEPVGRLVGEGVTLLRRSGGTLTGRMGLTHGMAAGIGAGTWMRDLDAAAFAAGFRPWLPGWVPEGFEPTPPRIEPDVAYPAAPPAIVLAWTGPDDARVLLRQAPAPLASPPQALPGAREVEVMGVTGILRGRRQATLVWETPDRAFGLHVRRIDDAPQVAVRVARSIPSGDVPAAG